MDGFRIQCDLGHANRMPLRRRPCAARVSARFEGGAGNARHDRPRRASVAFGNSVLCALLRNMTVRVVRTVAVGVAVRRCGDVRGMRRPIDIASWRASAAHRASSIRIGAGAERRPEAQHLPIRHAVHAVRRRVGQLRAHRDLRASACFLPFGVQTTRCAAHVVTCTRDGIAKATRTPEETR
jgi:hypothetical protein